MPEAIGRRGPVVQTTWGRYRSASPPSFCQRQQLLLTADHLLEVAASRGGCSSRCKLRAGTHAAVVLGFGAALQTPAIPSYSTLEVYKALNQRHNSCYSRIQTLEFMDSRSKSHAEPCVPARAAISPCISSYASSSR